MSDAPYRGDLIALVADKNMEYAVRGIIARERALGIRAIEYVVHVHPEKDPGCLLRGHDFLGSFTRQFEHALLLHDRDGCGQENKSREELEQEIEGRLSLSGWGERAAAIVLDPELEIWVWSDSPHVDSVLNWQGKEPDLRSWLNAENLFLENQVKPERPKEAMDRALREVRKPRSSSLYLQLAQQVSFQRCIDPAFSKLKTTLQHWFPIES